MDSGIWGTDANHMWFAQSAGTIRRGTNFSTNAREVQNLGTTADLRDIWGSSWDDLYAVGEFGLVFHYDGSTWSRVPNVPTFQTLDAIWGSSADDVFLVGDNGAILHYDGAGWTLQTSATTQDLQDVWGRNGSDVYAVGFGGTILHYDGAEWLPEASGVSEDLMCVAGGSDPGSDTLSVWVGGGRGLVLHASYGVANQAPAALQDTYSTAESQELTTSPPGVLANDTDADGDPLRAELVTPPAHGALSLSPSGWFTYLPNSGWSGTDTFSYRATDGFAYSPAAEVSIVVSDTSVPDTIAPSVTHEATYSSGLTDVTITATDSGSGVSQIEYSVNGGGTQTAAGSSADVSLTQLGANTLSYRARDNAGNTSAWTDATIDVKYTDLSFSAPSLSGYGSATVSGYVKYADSTGALVPLSGVSVDIQEYSGGVWGTTATVVASSSGDFTCTVEPTEKASYRASYDGGTTAYLSCVSTAGDVLPKVYLTRPSFGRTTLAYGKTFSARGYLKPLHAARTYPVKVYAYRYQGGRYVYKRTFRAKASDYSTFTRYTASIKLPSRGRWRLRAYHPADNKNAETYSSYRYVRVK
jgi:hypothetical protein